MSRDKLREVLDALLSTEGYSCSGERTTDWEHIFEYVSSDLPELTISVKVEKC